MLAPKCLFALFLFLLFLFQIRKKIRSHPGARMDARPPNSSHSGCYGVRSSYFWRSVRNERQEAMEPERPHGFVESLAERFFMDWNVPNDAAANAQSLLFEPPR